MFITLALSAVLAQSAPNSTELTVYNQGFGFVKELRDVTLSPGRQTLKIEDVAAMIDPTSVGIRRVNDPKSFEVLEQNYQYDLISPAAILSKSVGKRVRFIRTMGNQRESVEGTLLAAPSAYAASADSGQVSYTGMVIRTDDGRIILDPKGEVEVQQVPEGLISKPTLLWDLNAAKAGPNTFELSYITQGISWNADYVLTLGPTDRDADLKGWVTINNNSGASFSDARLKLLAGDINQARPQNMGMARTEMMKAPAAAADAGFREEGLFEYHLYTLQRPATVRNHEIKQLSLLESKGVQVQKKLILDSMQGYSSWYPNEGEVGTGDIKPQVRIEFVNKKDNQLGMPLPKGRVRIYKRDDSGSVQMLGEDNINHTPKDEKLSLVVGRAFDVVGTRKRTNFVRLSPNQVQESFEIEVRNRKDAPETVNVLERHWGDWNVTDHNLPFTKEDASTMQFVLNLKANEVQKVTYTVTTRW